MIFNYAIEINKFCAMVLAIPTQQKNMGCCWNSATIIFLSCCYFKEPKI